MASFAAKKPDCLVENFVDCRYWNPFFSQNSPKVKFWTFSPECCGLSRLSVSRMQRRVGFVLQPCLVGYFVAWMASFISWFQQSVTFCYYSPHRFVSVRIPEKQRDYSRFEQLPFLIRVRCTSGKSSETSKIRCLQRCFSCFCPSGPPTFFGWISSFCASVCCVGHGRFFTCKLQISMWIVHAPILTRTSNTERKMSHLKLCRNQWVTVEPKNLCIRCTCVHLCVRRKCSWCTVRCYSRIAAGIFRYHQHQHHHVDQSHIPYPSIFPNMLTEVSQKIVDSLTLTLRRASINFSTNSGYSLLADAAVHLYQTQRAAQQLQLQHVRTSTSWDPFINTVCQLRSSRNDHFSLGKLC